MTSQTDQDEPLKFNTVVNEWDDPKVAPDALSREAFAARIADALNNWKKEESLIVALYGEWGSGKTWLLQRIKSHLQEAGTFTVCDFHPWQFESNEQVTTEFFNTVLKVLSNETGENNGERAKLWATLGAMVSVAKIGVTIASVANPALIAASPILNGIEKLASKGADAAAEAQAGQTTSEIRDSLFDLFKAEDAPKILVTIDDLDRLPDDQIQMIFRLVKTTVNFPNLHFLILGERHQLGKALDKIAHNEGDRYLEKIVQIPIQMPEVDSVFLKNRLQEGLAIISRSYNYTATREELIGREDDLWKDFLKIKITNLRAVYRLLTVVEFKCSALSQNERLEVDLLDLVSIEFLRLYAPNTYNEMLGQITQLTHGFYGAYGTLGKEKEDHPDAVSMLKDSELGEKGAYHAISHLFPVLADSVKKWSMTNLPASGRQSKTTLLRSERPIWDPAYQPLYFKLSLNEKILSRSAYELALGATELPQLNDHLTSVDSHVRWLLFQHIFEDANFERKITNPEIWLYALCDISDRLDDSSMLFHTSECRYAYKIWKQIFSEVPDGAPKVALIESLFEKTEAVTILALLLEELRERVDIRFSTHQVGGNNELPELREEQLDALSDRLLEVAINAFKNGTYPITNQEGHRYYRLTYALGPDRFQKILENNEVISSVDLMAIIEAIARAINVRFDNNLWTPESLESGVSEHYVEALHNFASPDFWTTWADSTLVNVDLTDEQSILLEHIRRGSEQTQEDTN